MKGLNVRKLAAIAVGGALVGSALAPLAAAITLDKSKIVNTETGKPIVNVVVGTQGAAVSDFVWAGNIAAKVAQLATVEEPVSGGTGTAVPTNLSVDLASGGEVTYTTEYSYTYYGTDYKMNSFADAVEFRKSLGSGQLQFLTNTTKSYRYNASTYEIVVKETIGIEADAKFDKDQDVKDLVVYMKDTGDFNYVLDLGTGIPCWDATSSAATKFTDGENDSVTIPFLGGEYTVQECDPFSATKQIKLIKESAKTSYTEGDTISGLSGRGKYTGEEMSIKVGALTKQSGTGAYSGSFAIYDSNGNLVHAPDPVAEGTYLNETFVDSSGNFVLDTVVYVSTIRYAETTSKAAITVIVGKDVVTLAAEKTYPYDSTDVDPKNDYWKSALDFNTTANTSPAVTTLNKITIKNAVTVWDRPSTTTKPLWSTDDSLTQAGKDAAAAGGNYAHFLQGTKEGTLGYDFVQLKFDGFKVDQAQSTIKIGNNEIAYVDAARRSRTVPFYIKLATFGTEDTFSISGQTFYYLCKAAAATNGTTLRINDGNYFNGERVSLNTVGAGVCSVDVNAVRTDVGCRSVGGDTNTTTIDLNGVQVVAAMVVGTDENAINLSVDGNCQFSRTSFSNPEYLQLGGAENYTATSASETAAAVTTKTVYYDDDNASRTPLDIPLYVTNSTMQDTYKYRMYIASNIRAYLLLDNLTDFSSEFTSFKGPSFWGTDVGEAGVADFTPSEYTNYRPYYWPDAPEFSTFAGTANSTGDNDYIVAVFKVDANTSDANVISYIDTATGNLVTYPNDQLSFYLHDVNFPAPAVTSMDRLLNVRTDAAQYYDALWIDYGTTVQITDDKKTVTIVIPQTQINLSLTALGKGATQTVSGGDAKPGVKEKETVTFGSTKITVDKINATAGSCTIADTTAAKVVSVGRELVYPDSPEPAGNHIIVGGYLVNKLAEDVTLGDGSTLQEALIGSGDTVVELLSSGDIVVAGYTAADTETAAIELIDALDDLIA